MISRLQDETFIWMELKIYILVVRSKVGKRFESYSVQRLFYIMTSTNSAGSRVDPLLEAAAIHS